MSTPRRIRRNTKALDALKAAAIIIGLLIGCILVLWIGTQWFRAKEHPPDLAPQPGKSMWDDPARTR